MVDLQGEPVHDVDGYPVLAEVEPGIAPMPGAVGRSPSLQGSRHPSLEATVLMASTPPLYVIQNNPLHAIPPPKLCTHRRTHRHAHAHTRGVLFEEVCKPSKPQVTEFCLLVQLYRIFPFFYYHFSPNQTAHMCFYCSCQCAARLRSSDFWRSETQSMERCRLPCQLKNLAEMLLLPIACLHSSVGFWNSRGAFGPCGDEQHFLSNISPLNLSICGAHQHKNSFCISVVFCCLSGGLMPIFLSELTPPHLGSPASQHNRKGTWRRWSVCRT